MANGHTGWNTFSYSLDNIDELTKYGEIYSIRNQQNKININSVDQWFPRILNHCADGVLCLQMCC